MTNVFKNQILACLFLFLSDIALAANVMQISTATVQANQQIVLNVLINNSDPFVAFQLDLDLPAPFAYIANSAVLSSARTNGHSINATILDGNVLRILGFSLNNSAFKGTSGTIASFTLRAGSVPGNYTLTPVNAIIGQVNSVNVLTSVTSGIITLQSPDIALNTTSLDFGRIPLGSSGDQYVTLSNPGNQNLIISSIAFNSSYFNVVGSSVFTILPNGSSVVKVHFVSSAKGTYPNAMTITTNDPDQPVTTVSLQAVAFAVNELRCGNMAAYSGSQATVSLSVNNMEPFTGFQFDLQLPSSLTYVQGSAQLSARKTNHLVSANVLTGNVLRIVSYSADNHAFSGTSGDVVILKFAVAGTGGTYPLNLSNVIIGDASGTNIISASYNGSEVIAAADINSNSSMSFGDVSMLATSSQVLRLYNYGDDTLKVSQLQFSEPSFFAEEVAPFRVDKGAFKDITVKMHPSTLGSKTGNLRIFSNDPDENPKIISLTGNGYNANYISVRDTALCNASKISFQVSAENYEPFVGFQFDISFPVTMTYFDGSAKLSPRAQDHSVSVSLINATTLRVLAFSLQQKPFLGGTGAIVSLDFTLNVATQNTLPITLSNAIMGNSLSQNILYGTQNGTVTLYSKPSLVAASASPNPICTGTTLTLTGSATNATNWSWTGPNSFTSTLQNPTISSITTAGAGVYTLTAGNSCGSATAVNTSSVTVNSKPTGVTALGSPNPICASTTLTLTGSATNATSWSWTGPNSFTSTLQNPTISSITTAGAGVYTLTASNSCGSATAVNTSSITVNSKPTGVAASASPNPICASTTLTLTGSATNATNWNWTGPNSFSSTLQNPTISLITTAGAGVYTLTAGNSCGSATAVNTSSITVNSKPTGVAASASPNPICLGTTLTLTGSATNATNWNWTGPNSFTSTLQNPTISSITTAGAGVYTLTASNSCGSATAVNTSSITVNSKPTDVAASASLNPICASTSLTLTGSATNATNWNWTGPNSFSSTLQNPTISSITTAGAGVYALTASNSCGSATAVNTESIIVSCVGLIDGKDVTTKIYPNPTDGLFTFIYQNASGERLTNLDLYNNVGSHIKSLLKGENKSEINEVFNIQSLPNGTYYLVIRTQVRLYTLMLSVYKK